MEEVRGDLEPKVCGKIESHTDWVKTVCFSPDQTKLSSSGDDRMVILTDLETYEKVEQLQGHRNTVWGSAFSTNGIFLATASSDHTCRIWDIESCGKECTILEDHTDCVYCVLFFHNDPTKAVTGCSDKLVRIWDVERKKVITKFDDAESWIFTIDVFPNNEIIVGGGGDDCVRVWDVRSGKCVQSHQHEVNYSIYSVKYNSNSHLLASGSTSVEIVDFRKFKLLQNHSCDANSVSFHPSGKYLVYGSVDSRMGIINIPENKILYTLQSHRQDVWSVQFSPDGKYFASGSDDSKAFVWNFPPGRFIRCGDEIYSDELERVKYLMEKDLLMEEEEEEETEGKFQMLKMKFKIGIIQPFFTYKSIL